MAHVLHESNLGGIGQADLLVDFLQLAGINEEQSRYDKENDDNQKQNSKISL